MLPQSIIVGLIDLNMKHIRLKCSKCGGAKFIGETYYAAGDYYVDVTCIICSDTKDIKLDELKKLLNKIYNSNNKK